MIVYGVYSDYHVNEKALKQFVFAGNLADLLADKSTMLDDVFDYSVEKKAANWHPPGIRWFDDDGRNIDRYKDPDIAQSPAYTYILAPRAADLLRPAISDVAELLPIPFQGETWYFMNVFNQVNAMDKENSQYKTYSTGEKGWLEKPAFFADKVPHAKLFIMPEAPGRLYYAEHHPDPNPNTFKNIVEQNKLFGIVIEKVWEN